MDKKVKYKWHYEPESFIEEVQQFEFEDIQIEMSGGDITAHLDIETHESNSNLYEELQKLIEDLLNGISISSHSDFSLNKGSIEKENEKGGNDITVFLEPATVTVTGLDADFRITDPEGNVIKDTKQERIKGHHEFAKLISSAPNDPLLNLLIDSYKNAIQDPEDELVHLYEILEFLQTKLGNRNDIRDKLGISKTQLRRLATLANTNPLNQGRHRGSNPKNLRDATKQEINEARVIAKSLISRYARFIKA